MVRVDCDTHLWSQICGRVTDMNLGVPTDIGPHGMKTWSNAECWLLAGEPRPHGPRETGSCQWEACLQVRQKISEVK